MPWLNIWLIALLPPPPTPITLITFDWFLGRSNEMLSNSVLLLIFFVFYCNFFFIVFDADLNLHYSALSRNSLNFSAHLSKIRILVFGSFSFSVPFSIFCFSSVCSEIVSFSTSSTVSSCEKRFIKEDFSLLSKLFSTSPTAVAYIGRSEERRVGKE